MLYCFVEATQYVLKNKQRSLLALVGISMGSAAVFAMLNIGKMANYETVKQFERMGVDIVTVQSLDPAGIDLKSALSLLENAPSLFATSPLIIRSFNLTANGRTLDAPVVGTVASMLNLTRGRLISGRFISDFDFLEPFCVLGSRLADQLSGGTSKISVGSQVRIGRYIFGVVGILAHNDQNPILPISVDDALFLSLSNTTRLTGSTSADYLVLKVRPDSIQSRVAHEVESHLVHSSREKGVVIRTAQQLVQGKANQQTLLEWLLAGIGIISMLLGGVGIMNVILITVQQRRYEIGVRLAVGARPRDIQMMFLSESLVIVSFGSLVGILVGFLACYGFALGSKWEFWIYLPAIPFALGLSIAVGLLSGVYPAFIASRLDPVEALRTG